MHGRDLDRGTCRQLALAEGHQLPAIPQHHRALGADGHRAGLGHHHLDGDHLLGRQMGDGDRGLAHRQGHQLAIGRDAQQVAIAHVVARALRSVADKVALADLHLQLPLGAGRQRQAVGVGVDAVVIRQQPLGALGLANSQCCGRADHTPAGHQLGTAIAARGEQAAY